MEKVDRGKFQVFDCTISCLRSMKCLWLDVEKFAKSSSPISLNKCTKEFYEIKISDKRFKESTIKIELKNKLMEKGILPTEMEQTEDVQIQSLSASQYVLTFDLQKELLLLQMDHERMKQQSEQDKLELEKARMELEYLKLKLSQESKMNTDSSVESAACGSFPLHQNLKLVPKFNERDPDVFFSLFERVAEIQGWSKTNCVLLVQLVLVGKAKLTFSALTIDECKDYDTVKSAVLKVYECVPETYRQ